MFLGESLAFFSFKGDLALVCSRADKHLCRDGGGDGGDFIVSSEAM